MVSSIRWHHLPFDIFSINQFRHLYNVSKKRPWSWVADKVLKLVLGEHHRVRHICVLLHSWIQGEAHKTKTFPFKNISVYIAINMSAFLSTSSYYDLSAEERYEILASSWGLLTTSNSSQEEEEPARSNLGSSSSNPSHTMSRSKCYKLDLSSLAADMPLSIISQQHGADEPVSWGYFVDTASRR